MAKVNYQGAAQRKGFSPVNMNNAGPQRILQQSQRIADGMRTQADAILEDRQRQSTAMQENYTIQRDQEDMNFKISQGNLENQGKAAVGRINSQMAANASIFEGIANLSQSAAKIATDIYQYQDAKKGAQMNLDLLKNPSQMDQALAQNKASVLEGGAATGEATASVVAAQQAGLAKPVETSRANAQLSSFSPAQKQAFVSSKFQGLPSTLEAELSSGREFFDPFTGQNFKSSDALADARLYDIVRGVVFSEFMEKNGFNDLSPMFLAPMLDGARKYFLKRKLEVENSEEQSLDTTMVLETKHTLDNAPTAEAVTAEIQAKQAIVHKALGFDWQKTVRFFAEPAFARDQHGDFIMSEENRQAIFNFPIGRNGETIGSYRSMMADLRKQARVERINIAKAEKGIRRLEGDEMFEEALPGLEEIFEKGNPAEDLQAINTFEEKFEDEFGLDIPKPAGFTALKARVLNENKEVEMDLLESAQMGGFEMTMAQARSITDDTTREAAIEFVREQQDEQYGGEYQDLLKSLKGYAKQLTGTDLASEGISPMAQLLIPELQADFKGYYDTEIARLSANSQLPLTKADYAAARQSSLELLQQDVTEGKLGKDPTAKYAVKRSTVNNLHEFPNLGLQERASNARKQYATTLKSYGEKGEKVFDTAGGVLTTNRLKKTLDTYTRTGVLDIPPVVMKLSEISGELPVEILNRQIAAANDPNLEQIKPPDSYYQLKGQNPAVISLFHNSTTIKQRARALAQLPDNLSKRMGTTDFDYLTNTIAGVESTSYGSYDAYNLGGSNRGRTAHGSGNSAKDNRYGKPISQLTIGEIRRLHNSQSLFATGRYQFIPGTFREVAAASGLPDNTVFDKKTQDAFFLIRLRQRAAMGMSLEQGLRLEWVGLQDVSEAEYRRVVAAARALLSQ